VCVGSVAAVTYAGFYVFHVNALVTGFAAFNNNAEFSQVGDVTFTTKPGTNAFHGSLFEYLQNDALDAEVFNFNEKAPKRFNTFGGSLGGPVSIPKLYISRNCTICFRVVRQPSWRVWPNFFTVFKRGGISLYVVRRTCGTNFASDASVIFFVNSAFHSRLGV
jgi:hypothetical protein